MKKTSLRGLLAKKVGGTNDPTVTSPDHQKMVDAHADHATEVDDFDIEVSKTAKQSGTASNIKQAPYKGTHADAFVEGFMAGCQYQLDEAEDLDEGNRLKAAGYALKHFAKDAAVMVPISAGIGAASNMAWGHPMASKTAAGLSVGLATALIAKDAYKTYKAMKSTHDTNDRFRDDEAKQKATQTAHPLKQMSYDSIKAGKEGIRKGRKAAGIKEAAEILEVSKNLLHRYRMKAGQDIADRDDIGGPDRNADYAKARSREGYDNLAAKKMNHGSVYGHSKVKVHATPVEKTKPRAVKEDEQIDEISSDLAGRYARKAEREIDQKHLTQKTFDNRIAGKNLALSKKWKSDKYGIGKHVKIAATWKDDVKEEEAPVDESAVVKVKRTLDKLLGKQQKRVHGKIDKQMDNYQTKHVGGRMGEKTGQEWRDASDKLAKDPRYLSLNKRWSATDEFWGQGLGRRTGYMTKPPINRAWGPGNEPYWAKKPVKEQIDGQGNSTPGPLARQKEVAGRLKAKWGSGRSGSITKPTGAKA